MTRRYPYFRPENLSDGTPPPPPLRHTVEREVRFEEVDSLRIVWHGRYPSYFEDARVALGRAFGIGYEALYGADLVVPIKQIFVDYVEPLRFGERFAITAQLHWTEAARLNYSYSITNERGAVVTTGYTVQLFLNMSMELYVTLPAFYAEFCARWKDGTVATPAIAPSIAPVGGTVSGTA